MKAFILRSFGGLLLITGAAKWVSGFGAMPILQVNDPIFQMPNRYVLLGAGTMEIAIAVFLFLGKNPAWQAGLVAWLAGNFAIYRLGRAYLGETRLCPCLGQLTDGLHMTPETADAAARIILAYLLCGSCAMLFWIWRQNRRSVN